MAEVTQTATTATGKRKTAIARVRLLPGTGQVEVNGKSAEQYFPRDALRGLIAQPMTAANVVGRYDVFANITGGGVAGQASALRHGIARALEKLAWPATPPPVMLANTS